MAQRLIPSSEFAEWQAMGAVEPFGEERADWRVALSTAQVINHVCAALGVRKSVDPKDLLLKFGASHQSLSADQLKAKLSAWLQPRVKPAAKAKPKPKKR